MRYLLILILLTYYLISNAQVVVSENIDYIKNIEYANEKDLLDIYMPEGKTDVPIIVFFHGGALLFGDKSYGKGIGHQVAESGIGFVCVNYRLSPAFQHPAHADDAAAATSWVINNIENYGGNPKKIYIAGHSAGAYLAALVALDPTLMASHQSHDNLILGTILISPFLYVEETAKDRIAQDTIYKSIWGSEPQGWLQASVTPHIGDNKDKMLLIYADGDDDWRKEQNQRFVKQMKDDGNANISFIEVPNRSHSSLITKINNEDDQIINLIYDFVMKE